MVPYRYWKSFESILLVWEYRKSNFENLESNGKNPHRGFEKIRCSRARSVRMLLKPPNDFAPPNLWAPKNTPKILPLPKCLVRSHWTTETICLHLRQVFCNIVCQKMLNVYRDLASPVSTMHSFIQRIGNPINSIDLSIQIGGKELAANNANLDANTD